MLKQVFIFLLFLVFFLSNYFLGSLNAQTSVTGRITDRFKKPADMARVQLLKMDDSSLVKSAYTDSFGRYEINNFAIGDYFLKAFREDYSPVFTFLKVDSLH